MTFGIYLLKKITSTREERKKKKEKDKQLVCKRRI